MPHPNLYRLRLIDSQKECLAAGLPGAVAHRTHGESALRGTTFYSMVELIMNHSKKARLRIKGKKKWPTWHRLQQGTEICSPS